jgi:hypothetical protein
MDTLAGASQGSGKSFKLTVKIRYTEKIVEIDRENPGFLRKRSPFQNPGDAPALGVKKILSC